MKQSGFIQGALVQLDSLATVNSGTYRIGKIEYISKVLTMSYLTFYDAIADAWAANVEIGKTEINFVLRDGSFYLSNMDNDGVIHFESLDQFLQEIELAREELKKSQESSEGGYLK